MLNEIIMSFEYRDIDTQSFSHYTSNLSTVATIRDKNRLSTTSETNFRNKEPPS